MKNDTVSFLSEDGENIKLSVLEETKINGISYILVTDSFEGEDGECYIMKDISNGDSEDANYIFVEDENEKVAKLALVIATKNALKNGLGLLGMKAPERM